MPSEVTHKFWTQSALTFPTNIPACTFSASQALQACPTSPEPLQALASLRYEMGDSAEALLLLHRSMALWFPAMQERRKAADNEDGDDDDEDEDLDLDGGSDGIQADGQEDEGSGAEQRGGACGKGVRLREGVAGGDMDVDDEQGGDEGEAVEESEEEDEEAEEDDLPSYEFQFECAKLLLELEQGTETAVQVRMVLW